VKRGKRTWEWKEEIEKGKRGKCEREGKEKLEQWIIGNGGKDKSQNLLIRNECQYFACYT
jgi:hypothetical protein